MGLQATSSTTKIADVDPKLKKIFYPVVTLLVCLPRVLPRAGRFPYKARRDIDQPASSRSSPDDKFHDFVSKLAFLFWTDTSPATICACAILSASDGVEYVFAFNNRSSSELASLKTMIRSTLDMFHRSSTSDNAKQGLLRHVLHSCVVRVKTYLKAFDRRLEECIQECGRDKEADSSEISVCLQVLQAATGEALGNRGHGADEMAETAKLICSIYDVYKGPIFELVRKRALLEERKASSTCWTELIHVAGRLMTYKKAVDVSFQARMEWPELFHDFQVTMVPCSASASSVLNKKVLTTKEIIHKTTSKEEVLQELYAAADRVKSFHSTKLDDEIEKEWSKKHKDGIYVHAEINLLRYLETNGGTENSRFFDGIKFIGTSKPPCKLCSYFFQDYPTDVKVRESHGNLYGTWLMPDINLPRPSSRGETETLRVARRIRDRLRDDLLHALKGGQMDGRPHDSSNYSTRRGPRTTGDMWEDASVQMEALSVKCDSDVETAADDVQSVHQELRRDRSVITSYLQAQVSLDPRPGGLDTPIQHSIHRGQDRLKIRTPRILTADADTDDDDGGGVLVFHGRASMRTTARKY